MAKSSGPVAIIIPPKRVPALFEIHNFSNCGGGPQVQNIINKFKYKRLKNGHTYM